MDHRGDGLTVGGEGAVTAVLGAPPVVATWRALTRHDLRIVAYHDVVDAPAFRAQLEWIADRFTVVPGAEVAAAVRAGRRLDRAVWLTFDDGFRGALEQGRAELQRLGLPATAYVNPAFVEGALPWWLVAAAADVPHVGITALKRRPDAERRAATVAAEASLPAAARAAVAAQMADHAAVRAWVDAGFELGNHTWDHPCLDTCEPAEQRRQVLQAHDWFTAHDLPAPTTFAYPNGDVGATAVEALREARYDDALRFDHALCDLDGDPLHRSRLRLDADVPLPRARAVVGGPHAAVMRLRDRTRAVRS